MLHDPLYALSDVVTFAAASEKQFLNMIESQIGRDLRMAADQMEDSLANLSHSKVILDEHIRCSRETLAYLRFKRDSAERAAKDDRPDTHRKGADALLLLLDDYGSLLLEAESLVQRCLQGSNLLINTTMLEESRKAAQQNRRIGRLTFLAFFFVPMSFVGTFFGMNFQEFGQGSLPLWVGVVAMLGCLFVAGVICFPDQVFSAWKTLLKKLLRQT